ncbi:MAG: rhomboid family intramembrane serine protease, partial [Acidobacteriota bacterium]
MEDDSTGSTAGGLGGQRTHFPAGFAEHSSPLARAIWTVVQHQEQVIFLEQGPGHAVLRLKDKTTLILGAWDPARQQDVLEGLKRVMRDHRGTPLVVGLVGGDLQVWEALKQARPVMTRVKVGQCHIDKDGQLRSRDAGVVKRALEGFVQTLAPSAERWAQLQQQAAVDRARYLEGMQNTRDFAQVLQARRPVATWTLTGILLAVFGLEQALGGSQSTPVLVRMGALSPEHVWAGEWWRLMSCTFLHSGIMHLGFNTLVLFILGTSLERVLGTWRFLLLYTLSCLGGSLVSFAFLEGFSVGASGGLWGLLGAEAVVAWRSQGLLPQQMIQGARRATTFNLGINVLNSFRPHVDMWAHFGGGAVGAGLILSGLLTRGVPRLGALADGGQIEREEDAAIPSGPALKIAATGMVALFLVGLALGLIKGQPWALDRPFEAVRTPVADLGISLMLPPGLSQQFDPASVSVRVGNLLAEPGAVVVTAFARELTDPAARAAERGELIEAFSESPEGSQLIAGPEAVMIGEMEGVSVSFRYDRGLEEELAFALLGNALIRVNTVRWPVFGGAVEPGYASRVLASLEIVGGATENE